VLVDLVNEKREVCWIWEAIIIDRVWWMRGSQTAFHTECEAIISLEFMDHYCVGIKYHVVFGCFERRG